MSVDIRETTGLEIAVIGMAGRYPGAPDVDQLWLKLRDGVEPITYFSDEDLAREGTSPAVLARQELVRSGFILEDIEYGIRIRSEKSEPEKDGGAIEWVLKE